MVRRTKKDLQTSLPILPQKEQRVVLEFTDAERALYDYLERVLYKRIRQSQRSSDDDVDSHFSMTAAALLYLRLKQSKLSIFLFWFFFSNLVILKLYRKKKK